MVAEHVVDVGVGVEHHLHRPPAGEIGQHPVAGPGVDEHAAAVVDVYTVAAGKWPPPSPGTTHTGPAT